jgi:hypothetical protein
MPRCVVELDGAATQGAKQNPVRDSKNVIQEAFGKSLDEEEKNIPGREIVNSMNRR